MALEATFISRAWSVPGDVAFSVGRGNGKSGLVAGIASAEVDPDGPLRIRRGEIVCVASSFDQSRIIIEDVLAFLRERHDLGKRAVWRVQDSGNRAISIHGGAGAVHWERSEAGARAYTGVDYCGRTIAMGAGQGGGHAGGIENIGGQDSRLSANRLGDPSGR